MASLAQSHYPDYNQFSAWRTASGMLDASLDVTSKVIELFAVAAKTKYVREAELINAFGSNKYVTASYLAKQKNLSIEEVLETMITSNLFRRSLLRAPDGDDVYMRNRPWSRVTDFVTAIRAINALQV